MNKQKLNKNIKSKRKNKQKKEDVNKLMGNEFKKLTGGNKNDKR